jgi:hypothetical protein
VTRHARPLLAWATASLLGIGFAPGAHAQYSGDTSVSSGVVLDGASLSKGGSGSITLNTAANLDGENNLSSAGTFTLAGGIGVSNWTGGTLSSLSAGVLTLNNENYTVNNGGVFTNTVGTLSFTLGVANSSTQLQTSVANYSLITADGAVLLSSDSPYTYAPTGTPTDTSDLATFERSDSAPSANAALVPEPTSLVMLLVGVGGLFALRRRIVLGKR